MYNGKAKITKDNYEDFLNGELQILEHGDYDIRPFHKGIIEHIKRIDGECNKMLSRAYDVKNRSNHKEQKSWAQGLISAYCKIKRYNQRKLIKMINHPDKKLMNNKQH